MAAASKPDIPMEKCSEPREGRVQPFVTNTRLNVRMLENGAGSGAFERPSDITLVVILQGRPACRCSFDQRKRTRRPEGDGSGPAMTTDMGRHGNCLQFLTKNSNFSACGLVLFIPGSPKRPKFAGDRPPVAVTPPNELKPVDPVVKWFDRVPCVPQSPSFTFRSHMHRGLQKNLEQPGFFL